MYLVYLVHRRLKPKLDLTLSYTPNLLLDMGSQETPRGARDMPSTNYTIYTKKAGSEG